MGDIGGIAQGAGAVGAAAIESNAAKDAAAKQYATAQQQLGLSRDVFNQQQANIKPWQQAGTVALQQLSQGTQKGGQFADDSYQKFTPTGLAKQAVDGSQFTAQGRALAALNPQEFAATGNAAKALDDQQFQATGAAAKALDPAAFTAPTKEEAEATPGYQFTLEQGNRALQAAAAATGQLGGAAAKEALRYGQGLADTTYQQSYNRALGAYNTNLSAEQAALAGQQGVYGTNVATEQANLAAQQGAYQTNQQGAQQALTDQQAAWAANTSAAQAALSGQQNVYDTNYNVAQATKQQQYNRLAALAGLGQTATGQSNAAAQNYGSVGGNALSDAGAAQAYGTAGQGSAWAAGLTGATKALADVDWKNLGKKKDDPGNWG